MVTVQGHLGNGGRTKQDSFFGTSTVLFLYLARTLTPLYQLGVSVGGTLDEVNVLGAIHSSINRESEFG